MNDWPPPSADDAPSVEPPPAVVTAWWRHPMAQAFLVAWVVGGVIALVAIGFVRAVEPDDAMRPVLTPASTTGSIESAATASTVTVTTTTTTAATDAAAGSTTRVGSLPVSTVPPTTAPLVRSAPPVPPTTILVVTLPPTTTVAPPRTDSGPPQIEVDIKFDADGDDAANPNGEWVRFTNVGTQPVDMTNWIVRDDGLQNAHVFATLTLEPGSSVTLFSGCGEPTDTERFFCDGEVWNNDGDVVSLFDDAGVLIVQRRG